MAAQPGAHRDVDVAIVGYGPTGAVLANILGEAGVRVAIFDRDPVPMDLPRAVHFDGEVMRVFQSLGLADRVAETIRLSRGVKYYSASGQLLMERRPPTADGQHIWADKNMFHQPDLEGVLRAGIDRFPSVDVRLRHEVLGVTDHGEHVELQVRDEGSGETHTWSAAYAVGCDGGRSLFRREMGTTLEDFNVHDPWLVVDIELLEDVELPDCTVQYCDPARPTTYVHVTGARRRWEFKILPSDDPETLTTEANIWRLLESWVRRDQAELVRHAIYTFHALVAERWQQGRLFLAGDSAHQTPPFLGQGLCAGVRDAANLGWKLASVCAGAHDALLDTYETERRPHAVAFVSTAAELGSIIQTMDPDQAAARDAQMLAGDAIDFRDPRPPLGPGLHTGDAVGGRIMGQPRLSDDTRLDDLVGSRFAVLTRHGFADTAESARTAAETLGAAWVDDPRIDTWLEEQGIEALVLRPDRYVLGAAQSVGELGDLLALLPAGVAR